MEYKVGIDRVHINDEEENFPYPLKVWYDEENKVINVKLIRLPEYGIISSTNNHPDLQFLIDNNGLDLIIEVADGDYKHNNRYGKEYFDGIEWVRKPFHSNSGKFHWISKLNYQKISNSTSLYQFVNVDKYTLRGHSRGFMRTAEWLNKKYGDVPQYYTIIRAALRIYYGSKLHIYSNELKIWHNT